MDYKFIWGKKKYALNIKKHHVPFERAIKVFDDPERVLIYDEKHSIFEDRWMTIGFSDLTLLTVVYTENDDIIRLITARKADKKEEKEYFYGIS